MSTLNPQIINPQTPHHRAPEGTSVNNRRTARLEPCPTCRETTIRGLDGDTCALPVALDPTPLTWAGEIKAQQTGRRTYSLLNKRIGWRCDLHAHHENPWGTTHANHTCHQPIPAKWTKRIETQTPIQYPDF